LDLETNPAVTEGRTLGILGGMGPLATAHFYTRLVESSTARSDQEHPRVVIVSDGKIPDRTAFILGEGADPSRHLIKAAEQLAQLGADRIVVPCNSASPFLPAIREATGVEVVDWVATAASHLADSADQPVGIAATSGALKAGLYQDALTKRNISFLTPGDEQDLIMRSIYGPSGVKTVNSATDSAVADLSRAIEILVANGARSVLLACTELPILASRITHRPVPFVDPADLVIAELLRWLEGPAELPGESLSHSTLGDS